MTFVGQVNENEFNRVTLVLGNLGQLEATLADDISFQGQSAWTAEDSGFGQALASSTVAIQRLAAQFGWNVGNYGVGLPQKRTLTFVGTTVAWTATANTVFTIPLIFIKTTKDSELLNPIALLMSAVQPKYGENSLKGFIREVVAPHGYGFGEEMEVIGGCSIRIGTWFKTPPVFVVESVTPTISRQVVNEGKPLYATVQVTFRSARVLDSDETKNMFVL